MHYRKKVLKSVITGVSLLLISACASKMAVMESPSTDTPVSEIAAGETASAPAESAPAEAVQEIKDPNQPEVIPLAAPATETSEIGAPATTTADSSTQQAQQAAEKAPEPVPVAQEVIPLPDIAGITKKFINHRNTLWLSRASAYQLYAGGLFTTEYVPGKGTMTIKSDSADPALECKYTMDGKLDPQQASQQKACSTLTKAFDNYLSN